jgi:hypothetical protein
MKKVPAASTLKRMIEEERGNVSTVARKVGVSRKAIMNHVGQSPDLIEALADARETMLDQAESKLYEKVLAGETVELLFFLKTQGRSRGYSERMEVTGADGESLAPIIRVTLGKPADD